MLSLSQRQSLQQRLSPQQVQYLKMLQLPVIALEQRIKQEMEVNPMLEELSESAQEVDQEQEREPDEVVAAAERKAESQQQTDTPTSEEPRTEEKTETDYEWEEFFSDQYDDYKQQAFNESDDEEQEDFPQRSEETLSELLLTQLRMQTMSDDDLALAEEIIGNIDEHGYLRRDLREIVDDLNKFLSFTQQTAGTNPSEQHLGDGQFNAYEEMVSADSPFGRERLVSHLVGERDEPTTNSRNSSEDEEDAPFDAFNISFDDDDFPPAKPKNGHASDRNGHSERNGFSDGYDGLLHGSSDRTGTSIATRRTDSAVAVAEAPARADLSIEEMSQLSIEDLARMLEQGTSSAAMQPRGISQVSISALADGVAQINGETETAHGAPFHTIELFGVTDAERILARIQRLEPPGIGARDLRECLLVQLELLRDQSPAHDLAHRVISESYTEFTMKHFEKICDRLKCGIDELKEAIDVIKTLNPKPGEGSATIINDNYLTPDFVIDRDEEDFVIHPNDRHMPTLRINRAYQELMRRGNAKKNGIDRDTRKFLREKFEAAKWFIASIQQRRQTMMKVMRAIVDLQHEFFNGGPDHIRPMIYKDVAERIGMDISTVCRVVNGKYVQTDYGTFELRYFFSEKLETTSGEEVSTKIVKSRIQEMIDAEDKHKPLSDDAISKMMKKAGFFVARRTVAKYREQLNIPVARLRRAL